MAIEAKVVWSEGIFITPQHFQQFERYLESGLRLGPSGFSSLRGRGRPRGAPAIVP